MKYEKLPEKNQKQIDELKHYAQTIQSDVLDALESTENLDEFRFQVNSSLDEIIREAQKVRKVLGTWKRSVYPLLRKTFYQFSRCRARCQSWERMIKVKNDRIFFYNMNKRDIIPVDFQRVSAYLCPHCRKVLAAYYASKIVDLEPFMEDPALKHHYTLGTSNGGQYLLLDDHNHKKNCPGWEIVSLSARSITSSIDVWARRFEVGPENIKNLCGMIAAGKVPGFDLVQDACGADDPIVLYNEHLFTNMNKPGFGQSFIRKENLAAYVDWIVAGDYSKPFDPPIKPKTEPPIDAPKDDLPSLVDIEAEIGDQSTKSVFGDIIDVYTRAEAIEDGVLVDVTETAKEAGIVYPTAVTQGLWSGYIEPPESLKRFQDLQGRLWDVLTMFSFSARAMKKASTEVAESPKDAAQIIYFKTMFQMPSKTGHPKMETVDLKAICGPGDNAEPILTIMLLKED